MRFQMFKQILANMICPHLPKIVIHPVQLKHDQDINLYTLQSYMEDIVGTGMTTKHRNIENWKLLKYEKLRCGCTFFRWAFIIENEDPHIMQAHVNSFDQLNKWIDKV